MKRILVLLSTIIMMQSAWADEGMWLMLMLQKLQLNQKGCKLTPEQIYSVNNASVKDAIIGLSESDRPFNFFCSAEIVSSQGLVFTNYHCAFDVIQKHTNIQNNYIENGFWAMNKQQELKNDGLLAVRVVKMIDVSDKILPLYSLDKPYAEIQDSIKSVSAEIEKSISDTSQYFGSVKGFFENNQYFLFVYEKFQDVRLVGAPPRTIGKFGGDTDNWMWPRHTGDFAVLRIYTDAQGKPAEYSENNIAYKPIHFLPVSLQGYEKGDYAMVMGYPGSTDRYMTSTGIHHLQKYKNSSVITIGTEMLQIYKAYMNQDSVIKIQYAAKYDQMSNYWKYAIGQNQGITKLDVVQKKKIQEDSLRAWINKDPERKAKYDSVFIKMDSYYEKTKIAQVASNFLNIGLFNSCELIMFTYNQIPVLDALGSGDPLELKKAIVQLQDENAKHFENYDITVDYEQFIRMTELIYDNTPVSLHPEYFTIITKKYKGNIREYAADLYNKSIFSSKDSYAKFLEKPSYKAFKKDPAFVLLQKIFPTYFAIKDYLQADEFNNAQRLHVQAVLKQNPDSLYYPDANSTLRLTYGYIGDYIPRDAVHYKHYTTLQGIIEKENPKNDEFIVPQKLVSLYNEKDFAKYTNKKGELPVCFITNNDITGGNSGSAVMNAKGELIGIAFDGNWEAMSGDIIFEPQYQKCIAVDVRYVLFIIDKYAGAGYLLDEMTIK